jgi:CheY-like chemotaxis protein
MYFAGNIHLLLIENNEIDVKRVEREFKQINELITITVARDNNEALDKLYGRNGQEKPHPLPNAIFLDINPSRIDSMEFLKLLRKDVGFRQIKVFLFSASCPASNEFADFYALNVSGCIIKPLEHLDALKIFWNLQEEPSLKLF